MKITAFNPPTDGLEATYLSSAVSAAVTSLPVDNGNKLGANDRILIGQMGTERAEVVTVSSSTDTALTVGATKFSHDVDSPVYELRYDKVKFYKASSLSGSYSLLATVDLDVDNADLKTVYDDTTGLSTDYYKVSYYHSVSTVESSLSDPIPGGGSARNTVGKLIDEVLKEVGDENEVITNRNEILSWLNEVSEDLQTRTRKPYDFLHTRTTLNRTANVNYIDFPTDANGDQTMWKFDRLDYNYVDTTTDPDTDRTYTLRVITPEEFRNRFADNTISSTTVDDNTQLIALDSAMNRFRIYPPFETTSSAVLYLYYWKFFTVLDSEGDQFETPNQRVYKLYALARFYRKQSAKDNTKVPISDRFFNDYETEVRKYTAHNMKDVGSARAMAFRPQTYRGWRGF